MTHVATIIAARPSALDAAMLARAQAALPAAGEPDLLDPGHAADIPFDTPDTTDLPALADKVRVALGETDVVVQPSARRRKKLFLADMDSTMIGQECIDELADYAGLKAHVAAITERAMRGEIEFEPALRERVALLKDLPVTVIDEVIRERIRLTPGARTLVRTMRANGAYTCLVSGGFTHFTSVIAKMIGFDEERSNTLLASGGKLGGLVEEPIFGRDGKRAALRELRTKLRIEPDDTMATGDGANDMAMIEEAGLGVAFHAKPKVAAMAPARIEHGDLTALLYIQGYRRGEFVED